MDEMKEAVGNWREAKQFSPADENDFLRWLDKADTEEKLFSRLTFWFTFRGLPADQNQRYHLVQERARELRLWNGLELKLRRWQDRVADEYEQIGKEAFAARIGEDYADYINSLTDPEAAPQQAAPEPEIAKPAGVQAWSARELSEMVLPPIRHVVEGLLPMGMGVLVAKPKLGKSWMVLDLCLAVAQGEPFLEFPIVKDTTPNMMNPRLYTTSYNKPQGQQFDTAVLSFIKLQYTEKSCKMINIFVLVTILGHLPVILSAKSKGSEDMKQILIVEDDSFLNKMLAYNLTADGYGVTSALNARTAADAIRQREFDLVLLDINLPDGNGFELCKLIKPQHPDTIVIFLTANDQESDQIRGYEVGAVDYITKPFVIGALQRKIKAMFAMLEHHKPAKDIYDDGRLFLDFSEQTASLNGKPLTLSPMEYKMLNLFRKNPRQVLTRGQLLEKLWDIDERYVDEHTLTTSISRIRSKIESDGGAPYIKTVYGMGYQWTGGEAK